MENIDLSKNFGQAVGMEISKGEPGVIKALQKLWQKMQILQQAHLLEKLQCTTNGKKNEPTFPELQLRLLELQIQYVRKLLHKNNGTSILSGETDVNKRLSENERIQLSLHECTDHIPTRDCCDKVTQTDGVSAKFTNSLYSCDEISPASSMKNPRVAQALKLKNEFVLPDSHQLKITSGSMVKPRQINVGLKHRNSQTHYHLKLSDVPFLIGTSTSSHSVVANVQKIISMMKVHNKGLCSTVPSHPRRSHSLDFQKHDVELGKRTYSSPDLSEQQDLKNRLFFLSDELKALTVKLGNMKHPGNSSSSKSDDLSHTDYAKTLNLIEMKTRQFLALQKALRKHTGQNLCKQKSFSQSSPCPHYPEKLTPTSNDSHVVNKLTKTEMKHVIYSSSSSSKADFCERRKMVRELKEFQFHLQEEDIYWK